MSWLISSALMNSLYSRGQEEESWAGNSLDGEQSVQSSGNPTQQAYCAPDKMTGFSRLSRFGMTFKPLTENRGEELLTLFREDFRAKTFLLQETETDLMENEAECGEKWHGLLAKFDQDSHLWRTVQCSLLEDLNESLQTLPQWGMTVGGELYLRPTLVQTIDAKESGFTHVWGTPKAQDSRHALSDRGKGNLGEQVSGLHNGGKLNPTWTEWLMGWPLEWTDLKPLETDKFHSVPQQRGKF
jgi:hypothetical protein